MKKIFLPFLLLGLFAMTSCGDDLGDAAVLADVIVGTWKTDAVADLDAGTVTFNADGTGSASDNSAMTIEVSDGTTDEVLTDFTWEYIEADNMLELSYESATTSTGGGVNWEVGDVFENQINLSIPAFGLNVELNK
ncbi:hypothetical protein N8482_00580 [Chitinophagales bacterium]|nr:hypothetical protein [Chitinophagales bacterium]